MFDFSKQRDIPFDQYSEHIMNLVYTVQTLKTLEKLEEDIEGYIEFSGIDNHVTLNFLFYTKAQAALKVNKFLANVPVNHLKQLSKTMMNIQQLGNRFFGKGNWNMGLNSLYYLIPMKIQKNDIVEKRKILLLYESLLSNKVLSYDWLIQQYLLLAKVHMFEQYPSYQINASKQFSNDFQLVSDMLRAQLLLKMLKTLQLVQDDGMEYQLEDEKLSIICKEGLFSRKVHCSFSVSLLQK